MKKKTIKKILGYYDLYAKNYINLISDYNAYVKKREERGIKGPKVKKATLRELPQVPLFYLKRGEAEKYLDSLDENDLLDTLYSIEYATSSYSYITIREMNKFFNYQEKTKNKPKSPLGMDPTKSSVKIKKKGPKIPTD